MDFFEAVGRYEFLQLALLSGLLASIAAGFVGTYVVSRGITYLAGSMAHFVLGGMGIARYLQVVHGITWLTPLHGAIIAALLGALIIAAVRLKSNQREDTVIGALWAIGMAVGILFISRTPGFNDDLMSYLFGNILMVTRDQVWMLVGLDVVVVIIAVLFYNPFFAISFDETFARVRGTPTAFYYVVLLILTALTVVVLTTVVGIVMVIALLTLPAAIAGQQAKKLWQMMLNASILSALFTTAGIAVSYEPDYPTGATIILIAGASFVISLVFRKIWPMRRRKGEK